MGSETTMAPFGIEKLVFPLNVTVCRVDVWIVLTPAAPPAGSATVTPLIGRATSLNAFEMRMRI